MLELIQNDKLNDYTKKQKMTDRQEKEIKTLREEKRSLEEARSKLITHINELDDVSRSLKEKWDEHIKKL